MELAASIGIKPMEFWDMTPRELHIAIKGHNRIKENEIKEYEVKFKNEQKSNFYVAFMLSRWVWAKKVDIEKFMNSLYKVKKEMTAEEMLAQVQALNMLFGGEVIHNGAKK